MDDDIQARLKKYLELDKEAQKYGLPKTQNRTKLDRKFDVLSDFLKKENAKLEKKITFVKSKKGKKKRLKTEYDNDIIFYQTGRNDHQLLYELKTYFKFSLDIIKIIHSYCCQLSNPIAIPHLYVHQLYECKSCSNIGLVRYHGQVSCWRDKCTFCGQENAGVLVWMSEDIPIRCLLVCRNCIRKTGYTLHSSFAINCPLRQYDDKYGYQQLSIDMRYYDKTDIDILEKLLCSRFFQYRNVNNLHQAYEITYPEPALILRLSGEEHYNPEKNCNKCGKWRARCRLCNSVFIGPKIKIIHDDKMTLCLNCAPKFLLTKELIDKYSVDLYVPGFLNLYQTWNPKICRCNV